MARTLFEDYGIEGEHRQTSRLNPDRALIFLRVPVFINCVLFALSLSLNVCMAYGQGTAADYERSENLDTVLPGPTHDWVTPHWAKDGDSFWYRSFDRDGAWFYYWVDAIKGTRGLAFNHDKLADVMTTDTGGILYPDNLPIATITKGKDGKMILVDSIGDQWVTSFLGNVITPVPGRASPLPSLPMMADCPASTLGGEQTTITFINRTAGPVRASRSGFAGELDGPESVELPSGLLLEAETYAGTVWLITDMKGERLGSFEAVKGGGNAVIADPSLSSNHPAAASSSGPASSGPSDLRDSDDSPDGKWKAFVRDSNVFIRDLETSQEYQLSSNGKEGDGFDGDFIWAPNSLKFVALWRTSEQPETINLVQSSPLDRLKPILLSYQQCWPGDVIASIRPHLFDIIGRKELPISDRLFPNGLPLPPEYFQWEADSKRFLLPYLERGCQVERLIYVDAASGQATAIVEERGKTFLGSVEKFSTYHLDNSNEIIWASQRDGWDHLYLYDSRTGRLKNRITRGNWVVQHVDRVDEDKRQVFFEACGLVPGQNPYYIHYCRVNFDGTGLLDLTPDNGTHSVEYSPDGRFYLDRYSRLDLPPATDLRRSSDGSLVCHLETGDASELFEKGWTAPEQFVAKGRDGTTDIYGVIYRPTNFDRTKKYPIIEDVYPSPLASWVPTSFTYCDQDTSMAELGFIVVRIDAMGSGGRSKAFQDVCWHNLGDCGFPDRIRWMKAAAAKYPQMDLTRVGIFGGSEGGYAAVRALELDGGFYKVAVAECGDYDFRLFDYSWGERFMGWPVGPWYAQQSDVTNADKLKGKLLLISCELDRVVDPACTTQMANALIKANKYFELLVIPNAGHCEEGKYGNRRREDFFVRNLLGVEPPPLSLPN